MTAGDKTIPHEALVRAVINDEVADDIALAGEDYVVKVGGTIASPGAISGTYSQAEVAALKTAIDAIRAKLTASGLTA